MGIVVLNVTHAIAQAHGGGIDREVYRTGTATGLRCHPDAWSLNTAWVCTADHITYTGGRSLPASVRPPSGQILAQSDLSGQDVAVTTHLPINWQWRGGTARWRPDEILLAPGCPVSSAPWDALWLLGAPVVLGLALLVAVLWAGRPRWSQVRMRLADQRDYAQLRRRHRRAGRRRG